MNPHQPRRTVYQVELQFDRPAVSSIICMPRLPERKDRMLIIFTGNLLVAKDNLPSYYEVVKIVPPGIGAREGIVGTIHLRRLSPEEFPKEIGEDSYIVPVQ